MFCFVGESRGLRGSDSPNLVSGMDPHFGFQNCGKYLSCSVPNECVICFLGAFTPHCQVGIFHEKSDAVCCPQTYDGFYMCCGRGVRGAVMTVADSTNGGKITCDIYMYTCLPCITCSTCEIARLNSVRRGQATVTENML